MERYLLLWVLFILFLPQSSRAFSDWMMRRRHLQRVRYITEHWVPKGQKVVAATAESNRRGYASSWSNRRKYDGFCLAMVGRNRYDFNFRFQVWTWQGIVRDADNYADFDPWEARRDAMEALDGTPVKSVGPMFVRKDGLAEIITDDGLYELDLSAKTARKLNDEPRLPE